MTPTAFIRNRAQTVRGRRKSRRGVRGINNSTPWSFVRGHPLLAGIGNSKHAHAAI